MDVLLRVLVFVSLGLVLWTVNIWYMRAAYQQFVRPQYVIAPFNVIDPSGASAVDKAGEALAQMLAARLSNVQAQLRATRAPADRPPDHVPTELEDRLGATALFISRPVDIPTDLFAPVVIEATVAGVELGGLFSFFHRRLSEQRSIKFTTYQKSDAAIVTADLGRFAPGSALIWFNSSPDPDEIATNAAFALLHAKLSEIQPSRMRDLVLADFRRLIETIIAVDQVNHKARKGFVVTDELAGLLTDIEEQLQMLPDWPELIYLAGSTAEGAGNLGKAALHYRRLQSLSEVERAGSDARVLLWARQRLSALGASGTMLSSEVQERFIAAMQEFSGRMALSGADPEIVFVAPDNRNVQAIWNAAAKRYEVNVASADTAGLPQYVALMGRFFLMHFDRCFEAGRSAQDSQLWNEFRYSVVEFLIRSHDDFKGVQFIGSNYPLYGVLNDIAGTAGREQAQRFALRLLESYDCDWTQQNLKSHIAAIAEEGGLVPKDLVTGSMEAAGY